MGAIWHQPGSGALTCTWLVHARIRHAVMPPRHNRRHDPSRGAVAMRLPAAGCVTGPNAGSCRPRARACPGLARIRIAWHDRAFLPCLAVTLGRYAGPQRLPLTTPCTYTTTHHAMLMRANDAACLALALALRSRVPVSALPSPQQLG